MFLLLFSVLITGLFSFFGNVCRLEYESMRMELGRQGLGQVDEVVSCLNDYLGVWILRKTDQNCVAKNVEVAIVKDVQ